MISLGLILLIIGYILGIGVLNTIGSLLLVVGLIMFALGAMGRPIGPRAHYF